MAKKKRSDEEAAVRVSLFIGARQKAALEALSARTRVPWSEYVREGIELVLARYRARPR